MKGIVLIILGIGMIVTGCSKLSSKAQKIVGEYYNVELSDTLPMYELKKDGTCVVRNQLPEVLTMEVQGTWDVRNDSLVINNDLSTVRCVGDTSLIGSVAPAMSRKLVDFDDHSITLGKEGVAYRYEKKL